MAGGATALAATHLTGMFALRNRRFLFMMLLRAGLLMRGETSLHAASFDCAKAQHPVEKIICGKPSLNAADELLGRQYRAVLAELPVSAVPELRADQVQWLAWMQEICLTGDASRSPADAAKCMEPVYRKRVTLLRTAVARRDGITFLTRTQYLAASEAKNDAMGVPDFPGFGTLQASWPEAVTADKPLSAWNREIAMRAFLLSGGREGSYKASPLLEPHWTAELAVAQDAETLLQVKSLEHGRVTSSSSWNAMGHGAAHPNEAFTTLTWLLEDGRALRATDVFVADPGWQAKVAALCWAQILKQGQDALYPEVNGPDAKPLLDDIANVSNWTLEPDGLHISYPEYSISPRAFPIDDSVIAWSQLKALLAPAFIVP